MVSSLSSFVSGIPLLTRELANRLVTVVTGCDHVLPVQFSVFTWRHQILEFKTGRPTKFLPSFKERLPKNISGARFSKVPVISGPVNLSGNLPGNFTGPDNVFLEAPVNFPGNFRAR